MNISIKREQNNARISSAEREKFGAKLNSKILSPLRRDGYKAGMIMMLIALSTMLLTTACSSEDDLVNNNNELTAKKGYELPVTVNVTRGDGATRATYNETDKVLEFSAGDKLFVKGSHDDAGNFAGELDYDAVSGKFSGTIYTEEEWTGTADALFTAAKEVTATLLPNGYDKGSNSFLFVLDNDTPACSYDDTVIADGSHAFVASETAKATGVEQLSFERTYTYSSGFALAPLCAILNFTISGLEAGEKTVTLNVVKGTDYTVTGSVTPNASGVATFAIGVPVGANIKDMDNNLTVGTHNFTLPSTTTFAAGKIYNIARSAAPAAKAAAEATAEDKGKLIGTDGNIYADVAAATAAGTTAVAKIIYLGTTGHATYSHGLALALTDEGQMAWGAAMTACNTTKNTSTPVTGATWLLASTDQWGYMLGTNGAGSYTALRDGFTSVGGSNLQSSNYWSSTDGGGPAYSCVFGSPGGWSVDNKSNVNIWVRACLAF